MRIEIWEYIPTGEYYVYCGRDVVLSGYHIGSEVFRLAPLHTDDDELATKIYKQHYTHSLSKMWALCHEVRFRKVRTIGEKTAEESPLSNIVLW